MSSTMFVMDLDDNKEIELINKKALQWTRDQAIDLCMQLEAVLAPSYHVGLAGSCLYRGDSNKDVDIIVYPHGNTDRGFVKSKLISLNWSMDREGGMGLNRQYPSKTYIEIWKTGDGRRVDVFYFGEHINAF